MPQIVLALIGAAYLGLAAWCTLAPATTSNSVGFEIIAGRGQSEYLVVYGGLQLGLGLFFLSPLLFREDPLAVLRASLLIHGVLVAFRTAGYFLFTGTTATTHGVAAAEWLCLIASAAVYPWRSGS
ncbi:MAG: hypothetical protein KF774_09505 [Planctomyces sp.]|nr:hypothetical protein [Planctomyces sp.]